MQQAATENQVHTKNGTSPIAPPLCVAIGLAGIFFGMSGARSAMASYLSAGANGMSKHGNISLWSLVPEEIAYCVFCLFWVFKLNRPWILLIALIFAIASLYFLPVEGAKRMPLLAPAFFCGLLAYSCRARLGSLSWAWIAVAICTFALSRVPAWLPSNFFLEATGEALGVVSISFLCVFLGVRLSVPKLPVDWSYSIYAYHAPLLFAGQLWALPVLCWASYKWIEKPSLSLKNWTPNSKRAQLLSLNGQENGAVTIEPK